MSEQQDVIAVLVVDHREVEELFSRLEHMVGRIDEKAETLAEQVVIELVRHSVAEEAYLYPAVREHVPGGDALADEEIAEHAAAERTMKQLEGLESSDTAFWPTLERLMDQIRHHVREQENDLFPRLRQACSEAQLLELGGQVTRAKKMAPLGRRSGAARNRDVP
ncbi:hemerythrin domain-containing protein [Nonomuraea sp. NBC_00507]|uniref:hemerythrin domain-containing protein n=1 Tax=Nonomuraea sp. NBC_00507 TaxID=2976002 RepID=UPI002E171C15